MQKENPFEELNDVIKDAEESDENEGEEAGTKRERAKYYVVDVKFVALNQRELRTYLEANDDLASSCRIVKGNEMFAKRKTIYTF